MLDMWEAEVDDYYHPWDRRDNEEKVLSEPQIWGCKVDPGILERRHIVGARATARAVPGIHSEGGELSRVFSLLPSSNPDTTFCWLNHPGKSRKWL